MAIKQVAAQQPIAPAETIAQAITKMADATNALFNSGLNEKAILLLISSASGVSKTDCKYVLQNTRALKAHYLAAPKQVSK